MDKQRIAILGAGLAGLGAASQLTGHEVVIYEKRHHWGGHASSCQIEGFTFDEGPHISITKNERVKQLFSDSVNGEYLEIPVIAYNVFQGHVFKHPGQCHLYPLPAEIKTACLIDFIRAQSEPSGPILTYRDWCYGQFGRSFSEILVRRYTRKYWTMELEELTAEWVSRIHAPTLEQVVEGALADSSKNYHYNSTRYPLEGGYMGFGRGLARDKDIRTSFEVVEVHPGKKKLVSSNGDVEHYDFLISSLPLPDLIHSIPNAPADVREASNRLKWTSHFLVNIGLRGEDPQEAMLIYYYDEEIPFSRVSFPSKFSPRNAPDGHFSIQAEIVHAPNKPLGDPSAVTEKTREWLEKVNLVHHKADVVLVHTQDIRYANVIYDFDRSRCVKTIHNYLQANGIIVCGRYGEWGSLLSDEAVLSGERAAAEVCRTVSAQSRGRE